MCSSTSISISVWLSVLTLSRREIRITFHLRLAKQLLQFYPQFISHRMCPSCSIGYLSGTTR
ncbi:hypothetical protein OFN56_37610, partial [Escherichia coli]|nr:hypothetical protein [Escherichia coli]